MSNTYNHNPNLNLIIVIFYICIHFIKYVHALEIYSTGGSFPESIYNEINFAYKFNFPDRSVHYTAIGSTAAKCNIMGFWHVNNQNGDGPDSMLPGGGESIKRNDMRICQDACTELNPCVFNRTNAVSNGSVFISPTDATQSVPWRNGRPPLKDFVGADSILKSQDYVNYPDLQMLPAIAGPIELVYNIPELNMFADSLVLSRLTVANIFNGKIRSWNHSSIRKDNQRKPHVLRALAEISPNKDITVVVRTDGAGSSQIFTKALSQFDPSPTSGPASKKFGFDSTFAGSIGVSEKPSWCGIPDEIQELVIRNCSSSSMTIELMLVGFDRTVRAVKFPCDISQNGLQNIFQAAIVSSSTSAMGTVRVFSRKQDVSSKLITFRFAYQFLGPYLYAKPTNWYLPYLMMVDSSLSVELSTFQEGSITGVRTSHYDYPSGDLPEEKSVFINISVAHSFKLQYRNLSSLINVSSPVDIALLFADIKSAVRNVCGSDLSSYWNPTGFANSNSLWLEFRIVFETGIITGSFTIDSVASNKHAFVFVLRAANNLMLHFYSNSFGNNNSKIENNFGMPKSNSGFYNCYKRIDDYAPWSYDTGYSGEGVVAEVLTISYSIGYSVLEPSVQNLVNQAKIINKFGKIVSASRDSVNYAMLELGGDLDSRWNGWLVDGSTENVWPIVGYTYFIYRKEAHSSSCEDRTQVIKYLYDFYDNPSTILITGAHSFAVLSEFIREKIKAKLINEARCSDGTYALASYMLATPRLLSTDIVLSPISTYLSIYQTIDRHVISVTSNESSNTVWASFVGLNPDNLLGALTTFSSEHEKRLAYNHRDILTIPFAHFAVVPLYHIFDFQTATELDLILTPSVMTGILVGAIKYWNDTEIKQVNAQTGHLLPHSRIKIVVRFDNCDLNTILSRYLILSNNSYSSRFQALYNLSIYGSSLIDWSKAPADMMLEFVGSNFEVDAVVFHYDNSIGFFSLLDYQNSAIASFCARDDCEKGPVQMFKSNGKPLHACETDPDINILLPNGFSLDLMMSKSEGCYPIAGTLDLSIYARDNAVQCNSYSADIPLAFLRTQFIAWLFNPDVSKVNIIAPLQEYNSIGTSLQQRIFSHHSVCDIKCNELLGYQYCNYRDCAIESGDYFQIVDDCNPSKLTRLVHYEVIGDCRFGSAARDPSLEPLDTEIQCTFIPEASGMGASAYGFCALGVTCCVACLAMTIYFRKKTFIKRSQPVFIYIFIIGAMLLNFNILLYLGPVSNARCLMQPWFFNLSATLFIAPLLMKLDRVDKLFNNPQLKKIKITDSMVFFQVILLLIVDIFLLVLWTTLNKPQMVLRKTAYPGANFPVDDFVCNTGISESFEVVLLCWKILLLLFGVSKAVTTWKIPADISEAKHFAVAIYNISVFGGLAYFLSLLLSTYSESTAVYLCIIGLFICSTTAVALIMLPKFLLDKNSQKVFIEAQRDNSDSKESSAPEKI